MREQLNLERVEADAAGLADADLLRLEYVLVGLAAESALWSDAAKFFFLDWANQLRSVLGWRAASLARMECELRGEEWI